MTNEIPKKPKETISTKPVRSKRNGRALALIEMLFIFNEYIGKFETNRKEKRATPTINNPV